MIADKRVGISRNPQHFPNRPDVRVVHTSGTRFAFAALRNHLLNAEGGHMGRFTRTPGALATLAAVMGLWLIVMMTVSASAGAMPAAV